MTEQIVKIQDEAYEKGYADGVRDFAERIRTKDGTWSISEIAKELLGENDDRTEYKPCEKQEEFDS